MIETWLVKDGDVVNIERNGARMIRWMCNVRPEDNISTEELKTRLKLNSMKECLLDRRLEWFGHTERMEKSAWSSKCRTSKVSSNFTRSNLHVCTALCYMEVRLGQLKRKM